MKSIQIAPTGRIVPHRMASQGGVHAFLYGPTVGQTVADALKAVFYDGASVVQRNLGTGTNNHGFAELVFTQENSIVVAWNSSVQGADFAKAVLTEYPLGDITSSSPLQPAGAGFTFGDNRTQRIELITLADGRILAAASQYAFHAVDLALRTGVNSWVNLGRFSAPYTGVETTSVQFCGVVHSDGSVFFFFLTDGGHDISMLRLLITGNSVQVLAGVYPWIHSTTMNNVYPYGAMTPNGEIPAFRAVLDPGRRRVLLAYPNINGILVNNTNQSYAVITAVALDGTPSLVFETNDLMWPNNNPAWVSRANGGVVSYVLTDQATGAATTLVQTGPAGRTVLGTVKAKCVTITAADDTLDVVYINAAGNVVLALPGAVTPPPDPTPTPPPNTAPSISIVSIWLELTVYAVDQQEGDMGPKVVWTSSVVPGRPIGTGYKVQVTLQRKDQVITATVTDKQGLTKSESFAITFQRA